MTDTLFQLFQASMETNGVTVWRSHSRRLGETVRFRLCMIILTYVPAAADDNRTRWKRR